MRMKPPSIDDGQSVQCEPNSPAIYRYWNGTVRLYLSPAIAESWDPTWNDPHVVDCSSLTTGPDMPLKLPPPTNLPEGRAIKCDPNQPEVYRYSSGQRRWYPNPSIATSWDPFWDMFVLVNCSSLTTGDDMAFNQPILSDGQAVKCDESAEVFRFTGGMIRLYPDPTVADSWDPAWPSAIRVDCSHIPGGSVMTLKPAPPTDLHEGQAIRCDGSSEEIYRFGSGEVRLYPNPTIASSWDLNWNNAALVDCSSLRRGDDMKFNQPEIYDGQAVKCSSISPEIFRFANGMIRLYPEPKIADSWDPNWTNATAVDCSFFIQGPPMGFSTANLLEETLVSNPAIATSWDPYWDMALVVDCSLLPRGGDMRFNQPSIIEGHAVKCDFGPVIYRFTNGSVRWYPDPPIAESWDPLWASPILIDCSDFVRGPDMKMRLSPPTTLPEGHAIMCDPNEPKVFRLSSGQRRWYPTPEIASSWDLNWGNFVAVDCSFLPPGPDMKFNNPPLTDGQAVKCDAGPNIYRYTNRTIRWYPNPPIAASWDPNWGGFVAVDCSGLPRGKDMQFKQPRLTEGQAVKYDAGPAIFRHTNGSIRWYPDPTIAASWDPNWASPISVDCSRIPQGPEMSLKLPSPAGLLEGQAVKCDPSRPEVYRLTGGQRHWYPNPPIASSWDPNWFDLVVVDCSSLPQGADMDYKQPILIEGQAVKCDAGPAIFRYTNGTIRLYPDPPTAASWDPKWFNPIYVDCSVLPRGYDLTIRGSSNGWTQLDGSLVQLSFDGKQLCGVNGNDDVWCASENIRGEGPTNWRRLPGKLMQVTVYGDALYGVNRDNKIYFGSAVTSDPNWREIPGWLKQITTDNKQVCGVNALGGVFCADTNIRVEPNWRKLPSQFTQVELVNGRLFALRADSVIFSGRAYGGPAWVKLDDLLRQMSYDGVRFCGTNTGDDVWCANSGLLGNPNWVLTPGKMRSAVVQAGDLFATDQKGNIFYRRTE